MGDAVAVGVAVGVAVALVFGEGLAVGDADGRAGGGVGVGLGDAVVAPATEAPIPMLFSQPPVAHRSATAARANQ